MTDQTLYEKALQVREKSYAPYSGYCVGAALLTREGRVYTGCNVENAAHTPTCCAERTAFFQAISKGERMFTAIAVAGAPCGQQPELGTFPCGVCRQVMLEFCDPESFRIITLQPGGELVSITLGELAPHPWPSIRKF